MTPPEAPVQRRRSVWGKAAVYAVVIIVFQAVIRAMLMGASGEHQVDHMLGFMIGSMIDPVLFVLLFLPIALILHFAGSRSQDPEPTPPTPEQAKEKSGKELSSSLGSRDTAVVTRGNSGSRPTNLSSFPDDRDCREASDSATDTDRYSEPQQPIPMNNDDKYYAQALAELRDKKLDEASFARAFADGLGDSERTKALYVKYRAATLMKEEADERYRSREYKKAVNDPERARNLRPDFSPKSIPVPEANRVAAAVLAILFGWLGAHKIYMGKFKPAMIMGTVALLGLLMGAVPTVAMVIISIYEAVCYFTMRDDEFHRKYIVGEQDWF